MVGVRASECDTTALASSPTILSDLEVITKLFQQCIASLLVRLSDRVVDRVVISSRRAFGEDGQRGTRPPKRVACVGAVVVSKFCRMLKSMGPSGVVQNSVDPHPSPHPGS